MKDLLQPRCGVWCTRPSEKTMPAAQSSNWRNPCTNCEIRLLGASAPPIAAAGKRCKRGNWHTAAGYRPCPAPGPLAPQPAIRIRNPQSVSEIRNPYQKSVSYFFLQGSYRAFLWQGFFAIRKIRTSVNPYRKSVIRIMNP